MEDLPALKSSCLNRAVPIFVFAIDAALVLSTPTYFIPKVFDVNVILLASGKDACSTYADILHKSVFYLMITAMPYCLLLIPKI